MPSVRPPRPGGLLGARQLAVWRRQCGRRRGARRVEPRGRDGSFGAWLRPWRINVLFSLPILMSRATFSELTPRGRGCIYDDELQVRNLSESAQIRSDERPVLWTQADIGRLRCLPVCWNCSF